MTFPRSSGLANNAAINPDGGITITPQGGMLVGGRSVLMLNDDGTAAVDQAGNSVLTFQSPNGFLATAKNVQVNFADPASLDEVIWTGGTGTLTLTKEVSLDGYPILRVDMPSACTRVELGRTTGVVVPANWDVGVQRTFGYAVNFPTLADIAQITSTQIYVGDSTYTAFDLCTIVPSSTQNWVGWHVLGYRDGATGEIAPSKTGPVSAANVSRSKLRISKTAGAPCTLYVAWGGVLPRESAKIMWTADDGYADWYTYLKDAAILRGIPWTFGIDSYYVRNSIAQFMTPTQLQAFMGDSSGLFEFNPHGFNNQQFDTVGLSTYMANDDATWAYLQQLGVRNARQYHPYVGGSYDETTVAAFKSRGVNLCRTVTGILTGQTYKTSIANTQRADSNLRLPIGFSLEQPYTLANIKTAIDNAIATGGTLVIMAHQTVVSAPSGLQWTQSDVSLAMEYAKAKERAGLCTNIRASELAAQYVAP